MGYVALIGLYFVPILCLLSAGWRLSDGSIISVKYNGIAAKELFKVLKVLLRQ